MSVELFLSYDESLDWLTLIEFGHVENARPRDYWRVLNDSFRYLLDGSAGPKIGFKILGFSEFDPEAPEVSEIWEDPKFDVPVMGLRDATAGHILLAARTFLDGSDTINRVYFNRAMDAEGVKAERLWRYCLHTGDLMAHYGLGYTLYELGRYREAYRHLRSYTELVPTDGRARCWLGKACEAMGDFEEARSTYNKAVELGGDTTDAPELLANLETTLLAEEFKVTKRRALAEAFAQLPCTVCGSEDNPVFAKPRRGTLNWWDDPSVYVGCNSCGAFLADLPLVYPYIWQAEKHFD